MERRRFLKAAGVAAAGAALARPGSPGATAYRPPPIDLTTRGPGERLSLDLGWRFHLGDIPTPQPHTGDQSYASTKAGAAGGAAALRYDASSWRKLDLPHDYVVEGPFVETANVAQGYRPKGVAWYRRTLRLDPADQGKHLELQFDGIATNATVWVNGNVVAHSWSAYSSVYIDITAFARFGDELNAITVRVDADPLEGWWYEGGGIYRHAWLVKRAPVHLITDGVYAHPRKDPDGRWTLPVEATLANIGETTADAEVEVVLLDPEGRPVAQGRSSASVAPLERTLAKVTLQVAEPRLWSIEAPTLYQVQTTVRRSGGAVDEAVTLCGFRTQRFDPDKGFFLNDKPVKVQGVCIHQDHAGLGVALPDSIIEFRLRRLKALGCNAIRSSHNAPTRELLDAADRLGFLVMDENRLFNTSPDYLRLVEWMVRRDRNHPSVILWSVFNEEPLQGRREGYEMVRRMAETVKRLDTTRPVTAAMNGGMFNAVNVSQAVDVVGFNYQIGAYDRFHAANPRLPMTSSEDTSAVSTRGEYATDMEAHLLTSYDDVARPWGATHRAAWKAIATRPFVAGAFVWTGFDYRGEPQPFEWPTASSSFGIMDLCGFEKASFYIHQAQWVKDRPVLHLVPHWNWPGKAGQPIRVVAMANTETVALLLNGKLIGEQKVDPFEMNEWQVPYAPGRLEAVGRTGGKVVAHAVVETTGAPVALRLTPERSGLAGDGRDASPVTVDAIDAKGRAVPTANLPVSFEIEGGRIIGLGNGDANSHEPEKGAARRLYNGLAQVIVQTEEGGSGALVLRAQAEGLKPAEVRIAVRADRGPPSVARPDDDGHVTR
ncbi:beta-galactosidase GalA [Phenylobacterium sp.]|uniref:beta-galactosidase GalA n=1 Tax=Phenylobacterium sp. TaxID=1871053 RepID=UPI001225905C|nr:beta-galactosidase GalA [Phenylobacterium sp.]THD53906.1 MAG: glycoside hydrolase family 2 protein [Phenylobacterium sp.]